MTARVQDCPAAADGPRPGHARRRARPPAPPVLLRRRRQAGPGRGNLRCGANTCLSHLYIVSVNNMSIFFQNK